MENPQESLVANSIRFALENSRSRCDHVVELYNHLAKSNILPMLTEQGISNTYSFFTNLSPLARDDIVNFLYILYEKLASLDFSFSNLVKRLEEFISNLNVIQKLKDTLKVSDGKSDYLVVCVFLLRIYIDVFDKLIFTTFQKDTV